MRKEPPIIEKEPVIITTRGAFTKRELEAITAAEKKADKPSMPVEKPPAKQCPIKKGVLPNCSGEACAWYTGEGCANVCPHPVTGKICPYTRVTCTDSCALWSE